MDRTALGRVRYTNNRKLDANSGAHLADRERRSYLDRTVFAWTANGVTSLSPELDADLMHE